MNYPQIYRHYQTESMRWILDARQKFGEKTPIIKTDCYNEAIQRAVVWDDSILMIEINKETIKKALQLNKSYKIIQSDIRNVKLKENSVGLILDLSTLDHIHPSDIDKTVLGYYNGLLPGAFYILVVWMIDDEIDWDKKYSPKNQYQFTDPQVREALQKFEVVDELLLIKEKNGTYLKQFTCKKI